MFAITEKQRRIDGHRVWTFGRDVCDCSILEVEAGTNGFQGGDGGHGGRTYLRIRDGGGSVVRVTPIPSGYGTENDGFEMILAGDSELKTLVTALKFAVKVLEDQINGVED